MGVPIFYLRKTRMYGFLSKAMRGWGRVYILIEKGN
jgi:hypothetical protein